MTERESAEDGEISAEAIDRKLRSEAILRAEGVPFLATLPVVETAAEALQRSKEEVALRTLCLLLVAEKGAGLEDEIVEQILKSYELRPHLTPKELAFVLDNSPSQHDRVQFAWRYEAASTLLWALGFVAQLGKPVQPGDVQFAVRTMSETTTSQFIADSELRGQDGPIFWIRSISSIEFHWAHSTMPVLLDSRYTAHLDPGVTEA